MAKSDEKNETANVSDIPHFFRKFCGNTKNGNYDLYCQEFAYSIIYGNLNSNNLQNILGVIGLSKVPNRLMLVQTDHKDVFWVYPDFNHFPRMFHIIQSIQRSLLRNQVEGLVADYLGRGIIGIFLCTPQKRYSEEKEYADKLKELAGSIIAQVNEEDGEDITVGISSYCSGIDHFPQAYAECKSALLDGFRGKKNQYAYFRELKMPRVLYEPGVIRACSGKMITAMLEGNQEEIERLVDESVCYMQTVLLDPVDVRFVFIEMLGQIKSRFVEMASEEGELESIYFKSARNITNCRFIEEIKTLLQKYCSSVMSCVGTDMQSGDKLLVRYIDEAIEQNYSDSQFNLEKAAQIFHYSPYHFGRLFKRLYQVAFNRYISIYRIERAKELLSQKMALNEVAMQTGFSSVSYFCTVFKNMTGVSPKQYKDEG